MTGARLEGSLGAGSGAAVPERRWWRPWPRARLARGLSAVAALLGLAALIGLAGCGASTLPAVHSEPERLELSRRLLAERKYASAAELLKTYINTNQGSANVDAAIYLLGQAYLGSKDWALATGEFERLIRDYPESDSTPSAAFRLGEAYWGQARPADFDQEFTHKALDQWERYQRDYAGHWLNDEARRAIDRARSRLASKLLATGDLYLRLRQPGPARAYFQKIIDEYGDSTLLPDARVGVALADAMQGKRAEAIAQLHEIEREFHGRPAAERAARERSRLERKSG